MTKFYRLLALLFFIGSAGVHAQCTLNVGTSASTVCTGDNVTLTATATPPVTAMSLQTTLAAGNNHRGNMFDITAINTITITSFDAHPMANTTIAIYYKVGTWNGFANSPGSWTLVGSAAVTAQPTGTPTPVPVPVNVTIPAGQTYGFYVTSTNTAVSLNYTDGTAVGNVYASDANIQFLEGAGMEYPFTNGTGSTFTPRIWNGIIHYSVPSSPTYNYAWSTTETTQSINPTVNSTSTYSVTVNVSGCPTLTGSVTVTVSTPPVSAGADFAVCSGSSATLSGSGAVTYSWDNSVTDGVSFVPASTLTYNVTGTDSIGCTATDNVTVTVNSLPVVDAGPDFAVCNGDAATLAGSGASSYTWDNGVMDGVPFTPASTLSYMVTGTDGNGCVNTDMVTVTVNTVNIATSVLNETITALASGAAYQWMDCNTNAIIPLETNQSFTATSNGSYAVIVTENSCVDTSACELIMSTGMDQQQVADGISVYPVPATGSVVITSGASVADQITIVDVTGKVVNELKPNSARTIVSLTGMPAGIYFAQITQNDHTVTRKLIVQ